MVRKGWAMIPIKPADAEIAGGGLIRCRRCRQPLIIQSGDCFNVAVLTCNTSYKCWRCVRCVHFDVLPELQPMECGGTWQDGGDAFKLAVQEFYKDAGLKWEKYCEDLKDKERRINDSARNSY